MLLGNLGDIFGGVEVFPDARPDDGDARARRRAPPRASPSGRGRSPAPPSGDPSKSPFVRVTKARKVKVELDRKVRYELDGGDRSKVQDFKVKVEPGALRVCVPRRDPEER